MKIGDAPKSSAASRIARKKATGAASKSAPSSSPSVVDEVVLMGVPSAELTPKVRAALMSLMSEVQQLRDELKKANERLSDLEEIADTDPLLDILNRRAFVRELDRALAMIDRYGVSASLIFIDLNDLKKINDRLGHAAGDAALERIVAVVKANTRQTDSAGRIGGDEFGVLLLQSDQAQAERKASDLAQVISSEQVTWGGQSFPISISWGAVQMMKGVSVEQVMDRADSAMYEAKRKK